MKKAAKGKHGTDTGFYQLNLYIAFFSTHGNYAQLSERAIYLSFLESTVYYQYNVISPTILAVNSELA